MGGKIYTSWKDALGTSHVDEPVAVFENGKIYAAADGFLGTTAKGVLIGEYEDGLVYTVGTGAFNYGKRLNTVAVIEYGKIYSISKSMLGGISKSLSVGECSCGKVYSHSHKLMEGSESFGLYNGDEEGAAAAAAIALFKLESNVSAYNNDIHTNGRKASYSSGSYGFSPILCIIGIALLLTLFELAIKAIIVAVPTFLTIWLIHKVVLKLGILQKSAAIIGDEKAKKNLITDFIISAVVSTFILSMFISNGQGFWCSIISIAIHIFLINCVKKERFRFLKKMYNKADESRMEETDAVAEDVSESDIIETENDILDEESDGFKPAGDL